MPAVPLSHATAAIFIFSATLAKKELSATNVSPHGAVCPYGTGCVAYGTVCVAYGTVCVAYGTVCVAYGTVFLFVYHYGNAFHMFVL